MALNKTCSSSSSSTQTCTYDVFVSFYGKDTRFSFTDHLFAALNRSGFRTFRDDRELERGKAIWKELEKAIESSRIAVIVFSENYAASSWCLNELEKIMECNRSLQQIVLPVFYKVNPSELRAQKGGLAEVFAEHKERFGEEKVQGWRDALTEAANLSGWDSQNVANSFESESIKKIVGYIFNKLNLEYITVASNRVGLESRIQNLGKLLDKGSGDVCMVGIWGIGGIGKTTIAKAIYIQLQRKFQGSCFLENVRAIAKQPNGLIDLQEKILSSIDVNDTRKIELVDQGTMVIKNRVWCKRVLVVLDNVDHRDQLEKLAIRRGYFQPGSIIIITTRNKSMLKLAGVDENSIYVPQELDYHESLQLLSWHAFRKDHPNENFAELSKEVIYYAGGLPLVLEVLGSFLLDKSTNEWRGILEKLKVIPHEEIQEKLLLSFCSLSDTQKELFLDIACFFVGMEKNYTCKILQDSNLVLDSELGVLVRQCLVTIDCSNRLRMHDMIRDMGREVVRTESPKVPGERSRLWFHEDVLDVLKYHTGTKKVEGIMLNLLGVHNFRVDSRALAKMDRLKVLQLNFTRLKGIFHCPSKMLRYLEWYGFPMGSIPADLYMENLVAIYMPYSSLIELWTGTKILPKLKFLDVGHSYHLRRTPDFSGITNLEVLVLNNCTSLVEVHKSVVYLDKLVTLDLENCDNLSATNLKMVRNVTKHRATRASLVEVYKLPKIWGELRYLKLIDLSQWRRFRSIDELPIVLQVTLDANANNATSWYWILLQSNRKQSRQWINPGRSKLLKEIPTRNPRKKLLKELIALDSFSVFIPGVEFPDWFDYKSTGSILSFVVPPLVKQKIRGWFLCVLFAIRFHDIHGFTVICKFKNKTKDIHWHYKQKNCHVIPCQQNLLLHSVPVHHLINLLKAGDEVEYSIQLSGSFQLKKFGINLIYENDKKDYQSHFEAMIQNASLPYQYDFLHEDVSTDQAMAGDKKIHHPYVQMSRFGDNKRKGIVTFSDASKSRCLSAREAVQQQWDDDLAARLQDKEDVITSRHHPFHRHLSLKDRTALAEVENRLFDGNGQPYVHETPPGTMLFEGGAPYEQNLYSSCIPTMTLVSQTRRLRSLELLWEAECQLLRNQLENEQRAHWATREDVAMASRQLRVQNAAFESENIRLRRALAHTSQFSPQLYMDPPCPHFESESASSSQFATASSSSAPTRSTIAALTPMTSTRRSTLGLDYATFPEGPVLSIQSFNDPSRSSPPNRGSDLSQ